ncbi:NtaA/DmoA family FMN-dependent monooxygenase [Streptomyces albireticuli]|uniref:F420-dependent methylene-tetrahydromethanopterin reductase n=1 Tax=Streptomyces albireticuli TaxID=1940 RepID=A0A2A2DDM0_9ACTN|nr:NtaA/DmoA family FMN-dependent monooxygenase [Streptomyces albireticuli]MCD9143525.1 NtaA/DmoA family FMN-dependent monooxygenase [Streptomyces albireticuli]MCD9164884.1 NtaA/DmoA family FMN-dependent monooxygenase [Streptomyces albireticuli]MCD9191642.1 NtaA/DmoA family FMN-dependent monooxygenase [Streptomyces albireticuli]PAU49615.1 F420-dependent methylene-tetrahydromethanopterin reductase [Streptomyces albireticuli]
MTRDHGPHRDPEQIHLAVRFPGVDDTPVRPGHRSGGPFDFSSFAHLARTAERGLFDFLLLAGEPGPREHGDHGLDAVGRPEFLTLLGALAAVTDRLGLAATADTTSHEPYELARRLASLDHLSGGRAAWGVVTSSDALTGGNFRHGGPLDRARRRDRAAEFVTIARELWDSWPAGTPGRSTVPRPFAHHGRHFDVSGTFDVARSPQGHPVVIQAGDTGEDREFAAAADVVLRRHGTLAAGRAFRADVTRRLGAYGRRPGELKTMSEVTVVLGDTAAEAREKAAEIRRRQAPSRTTPLTLERVRGRDLPSHHPGGPPPGVDPDPAGEAARGRAVAAAPSAVAGGLLVRRTVAGTSGGQSFVGTPRAVAARMAEYVAGGAADGFVLVPPPTPGGLDEFVDRVVPLLQERGVFRTEYAGTTLREHLGLPAARQPDHVKG